MAFREQIDSVSDNVFTNHLQDFNNPLLSVQNVHIGYQAGQTGQGTFAVAIGYQAGQTNQGFSSVAVGDQAGQFNQGVEATAVGQDAGQFFQGSGAVAVGYLAGQTGQHQDAVAIGHGAGQTGQGIYAVAVGFGAAPASQPSNSIFINASGVAFTPASTGCYVNPIRTLSVAAIAGGSYPLAWSSATNEIYANSAKTFVMTHPLEQTKYLVHGCLEGPESGVYYRGVGEIAEGQESVDVELPSYCAAFSDFTAQISPLCAKAADVKRQLGAGYVQGNKFTVYGDKPGKFYWSVTGKRSSIDAEPLKADKKLRGTGPYVWLE